MMLNIKRKTMRLKDQVLLDFSQLQGPCWMLYLQHLNQSSRKHSALRYLRNSRDRHLRHKEHLLHPLSDHEVEVSIALELGQTTTRE